MLRSGVSLSDEDCAADPDPEAPVRHRRLRRRRRRRRSQPAGRKLRILSFSITHFGNLKSINGLQAIEYQHLHRCAPTRKRRLTVAVLTRRPLAETDRTTRTVRGPRAWGRSRRPRRWGLCRRAALPRPRTVSWTPSCTARSARWYMAAGKRTTAIYSSLFRLLPIPVRLLPGT